MSCRMRFLGINTINFQLLQVKIFSLVLLARDFNPEKYSLLSEILCHAYLASGSPASMLEHYLSVVTKGSCRSEDNGMFKVQDFDMRKAFAAASVKGRSG